MRFLLLERRDNSLRLSKLRWLWRRPRSPQKRERGEKVITYWLVHWMQVAKIRVNWMILRSLRHLLLRYWWSKRLLCYRSRRHQWRRTTMMEASLLSWGLKWLGGRLPTSSWCLQRGMSRVGPKETRTPLLDPRWSRQVKTASMWAWRNRNSIAHLLKRFQLTLSWTRAAYWWERASSARNKSKFLSISQHQSWKRSSQSMMNSKLQCLPLPRLISSHLTFPPHLSGQPLWNQLLSIFSPSYHLK